jgi:endonuclease YncB( thermonuclease family)
MRLLLLLLALLLWPFDAVRGDDAIIGQPGITDGDTLRFPTARVRLYGIDAPEKDQICLDATEEPWPCGRDSAVALQRLIAGQDVRCTAMDRDRYGRIIAICLAGKTEINAWMVENGWALAYRHYSTRYVPQEDAARIARRGLWRGSFTPPWEWRHTH